MTDRERIAELEAEVADNDAMMEIRHQRTVEADREWQQATGQHDVFPDLGTLIDWLRERARQAEASEARLRKALEAAKPPLEEFCRANPKWQYGKGRQDPCGGHAALSMVGAALSATGEYEPTDTGRLRAVTDWLDERDRAYPVRIFVPLCGYEHDRINKELQFLGISRDRLSADISRLWCQQLRETLVAPKEAQRG